MKLSGNTILITAEVPESGSLLRNVLLKRETK